MIWCGRTSSFPAEHLEFVHPIVRAALYEDLAPGERQARHAAAAEALAGEGASAERVTAHLLLTPADGGSAAGQARSGRLPPPRRAVALRGRPRRICGERWASPRPSRSGGDPGRARLV